MKRLIAGVLLASIGQVSNADTCFTDTSTADFQAGTGNDVAAGTPIVNALQLLATPTPDQENTTIGTNANAITASDWGGQTFTPSVSGRLLGADLNLFCSGCPGSGSPPFLSVSLRATSGGLPTGTDLSAGTISGFTSGTATWYSVTFSNPYTLAAGVKYALVVRPVSNPTLGTYVISRSGTTTAGEDVYAGGTRVANLSANWTIPLTGGVSTDTGFRTRIEQYASSGDYTSTVKDSGITEPGMAGWTTLSGLSIVQANTSLHFQAAASESAGGPFVFVGPDGTPGTYFDDTGASLAQFNGHRYLRYRALLATSDRAVSPVLFDATVCAAPLAPPDLSVSISDNRGQVQLGDNVDYLVEVSNAAGSSLATANITDALPAQLGNGSWVCSATGGATCESGIGNMLSGSVNLPGGAKVSYLYSATVTSAGTDDRIANTATAVLVNGTDPTPANNTATDEDILVIFADGFDDEAPALTQ